MGARTSSRKHGDNCFSLSCFPSPNIPNSDRRADLHVSKKPKISSMDIRPDRLVTPVSSQRTVSRIQGYPERTQHFRREVHAPFRKPKFSPNLGRETPLLGNFLSRRLEEAKSLAIGTLQYFRKDKAVIEKDKAVIDVEAGCSKDVFSEDSSVEELRTWDYGQDGEGRCVSLDQRSPETNGVVYLQERYANFIDCRLPAPSSDVSDLTNHTLKVNDTQKMLESLSVNHRAEEVSALPHKKLLENAERRNSRLGYLVSEIDLTRKKSDIYSRPTKKPEEDVLREPFARLTNDEDVEVSRAFLYSNRRKVLVTHENSNVEITGEVLQCLRPGAWLNDEVINLYFELLKEREKREPKKFLKCHFFNTFFYKKLVSGSNGYDFKAVRRWTTQRKIGYDLIECDKIFVPIHKEIHWCLAVINKKDEKFHYLDSLKGTDTQVLEVLARYFVDEVKDKNAKDIDVSSWKQEFVDDLPEQANGWDCGMFMIKYADFYSRGLGLYFQQGHMPYFRRRTAKEILRLKAE